MTNDNKNGRNADEASEQLPPIPTESAGSGSPSTDSTDPMKEAEKWKNDFLYLRAELDNIKKHHLKERSDLIKYGSERLIVALLEVVDNFDRALQTPFSTENLENLKTGFELIGKELSSCLERFGVKVENPEGKPFDPMSHEALGSEPSDSIPEGHVVKAFKKAYRLHDKMIRPAQVIIATPAKKPE